MQSNKLSHTSVKRRRVNGHNSFGKYHGSTVEDVTRLYTRSHVVWSNNSTLVKQSQGNNFKKVEAKYVFQNLFETKN